MPQVISPARRRILIADSNQSMAMLLASILRDAGYRQVVLAASLNQAITEIQTVRPDALLVDNTLRDGSPGIVLARWMRRDPASPCREAALLFVTAHAARSLVTAARDTGADAFLVKPVAPGALLSKLSDAMERPREFVRTFSYVGPCRRRRRLEEDEVPARRRASDDEGGADDDLTTQADARAPSDTPSKPDTTGGARTPRTSSDASQSPGRGVTKASSPEPSPSDPASPRTQASGDEPNDDVALI